MAMTQAVPSRYMCVSTTCSQPRLLRGFKTYPTLFGMVLSVEAGDNVIQGSVCVVDAVKCLELGVATLFPKR